MPIMGEVKKSQDIGYKSRGIKFIWSSCPECSKERWVQYAYREMNRLCFNCANRNRRKEGILSKNSDGYYQVLLNEKDFFYPMADCRRCVLEHRLVMAQHLGRCLHSWEIVHHKNHIRADNRLENLQLVSDDRHKQLTIMENRVKQLELRVTILEAENIVLRNERNALLP